MAVLRAPVGLGKRGRKLWHGVTSEHELDAGQDVILLEVCRAADRLDKLDLLLRGDSDTWARLAPAGPVRIDQALSKSNSTAQVMKQLLTSLRLSDPVTGKRPRYRGPRGAYGGGRRRPLTLLEQARLARDRPPR